LNVHLRTAIVERRYSVPSHVAEAAGQICANQAIPAALFVHHNNARCGCTTPPEAALACDKSMIWREILAKA